MLAGLASLPQAGLLRGSDQAAGGDRGSQPCGFWVGAREREGVLFSPCFIKVCVQFE